MRFIKACGCAAAALTAAMALGLTGSARAGAGGTDRHFQGKAEGAVTDYLSATHWLISATGTATHLGKFTRTEDITFSDDFTTFTGTIVLTDVNDDVVFISFSGYFTSPNDVTGTYTITGGEGKFDGATGSATFTAHTPDYFNVTLNFEGTINY